MSMFENDQYVWRETYFVLFDSSKRPSLEAVEEAITGLHQPLKLINASADESGQFESVTILAPDDFAALDICYVDGVEAIEQASDLAEELKGPVCGVDEAAQLERIRISDGRFDVLHFEQKASGGEDDPDALLDPSALLIVLDAFAEMCEGIAVDPQSGTMM